MSKGQRGSCERKAYFKEQRTRRVNARPERNLQLQIFDYLSFRKFFVINCEAKSIRSVGHNGRVFYKNAGIKAGTSDIIAVSPEGKFCAIELKSSGRRSSVKEHQLHFLINVIKNNGFAIVCDSIEYFDMAYKKWSSFDDQTRKIFLISEFPGKFKEMFADSI